MRILYHHRTRGGDAQGIHIRELIRGFRMLGHEVDLVALLAREANDAPDDKKPVRSGTPSLPRWLYELALLGYNLPAFFVLLAHARRFRPDLLYERYSLFAGAGLLVARLRGVPFLLEVNAPLSLEVKTHEGLAFESLARRMEGWVCRNATKTIVVTRAMARILEEAGVPRDRIVVMPNGVDRDHFHPGLDGGEVRGRHDLGRAFVVGFVGWMRPWHGVDLLLRAAARLASELPELAVLVVGEGPALPALRSLAGELGIQDRVVFTGAVPSEEIPLHVAAMDVAVQPNVTEYASPIKLFEYLAVGRAVIAPRKANICEIVEDGETGLLYTTENVEDLSEKIRRLHADSELRARLGKAGAALIEDREYDWVGNARKVVAMVRHP